MRDRTAALLIIVPLSFLLFTCSGRKDLGDGYQLVTEYSGAHFLVGPKGSITVCSNISRVKFDAHHIVGFKETPSNGGLRDCDREDKGYLIIDKQEGTYVLGLSEEDFLVRCDELSIDICENVLSQK